MTDVVSEYTFLIDVTYWSVVRMLVWVMIAVITLVDLDVTVLVDVVLVTVIVSETGAKQEQASDIVAALSVLRYDGSARALPETIARLKFPKVVIEVVVNQVV
jgi:hypothetical protein